MDLAQLANFGEFIGGVAVLVTLIYLALQVRQGTQAVEATNHNNLLQTILQVETEIVSNPDMAALEARGANHPEELSELEWRSFRTLALVRFGPWEAAYLNHQKGMIDRESWEAFDKGLRLQTIGPGYVRFWSEAADAHAPSFRSYVEREVMPV